MANNYLHKFSSIVDRSTVKSNGSLMSITSLLEGNCDHTSGLTFAIVRDLALSDGTNFVREIILKVVLAKRSNVT